MTTGYIALKVSKLAILVSLVIGAVSTTLLDAFVHSPSVGKTVVPNKSPTTFNDRTSCLFASTAFKNGDTLTVIDSWKLLPDGRIKGVLAENGDSVLTSPLKNKNGLREKASVQTVSGSRYQLGTPALPIGAGNNLSADRLGIPRATLGGINGSNNKVRATQPLKSYSTASEDGLLPNFLANKGRATMPLQSGSAGSPYGNKKDNGSPDGSEIKNDLLKPLVGGVSAIAIGAAIGTGVVSDKGIDVGRLKNVPDPSEMLKSSESLGLPDIKSLKAPSIPSAGVSFPKFEGLPYVSAPKFPGVGIKFPERINMPDLPFVSVPVSDGMKSLGNAANEAVENALENTGIKFPSPFAKKKPEITSVGQGPYRVPMPYLDRQILEAEKERRSQDAALKALAAEKEEAARIQNIREQAEAEAIARQTIEREQEAQKRTQEEALIRRAADERIKKAEEEAARLRIEVEKTRLESLSNEKAAAEEAALLKKEAEAALLKEQAAKEEFTRKLQESELAKLKEAQDFAVKLAEAKEAAANEVAAKEAAAKERALEMELIAKQKLTEEAASREAVATVKARRTSIGATAARKASYPSPSLSTYEAWQERQRTEYRTRMESTAELKGDGGVTPRSLSSSFQDNLSTYKKWQQNIAAKQLISKSTEPVTAAYITGAPAPVANQLVSGTTKLSEAAIALNGDLGYVIAGSSAVIGGIAYAYEYQKIQDELAEIEEMKSAANESVAPPSSTSTTVRPLPPVVPPTSNFQAKQEDINTATMAIDAKPNLEALGDESASVTKEVTPPPPSPPEGSYSSFSVSPTIKTSVTSEMTKRTPTAPTTTDANNNGLSSQDASLYSSPADVTNVERKAEVSGSSYFDSMPNFGGSEGANLKGSYSPFGTPKITTNDSLYGPPDTLSFPGKDEAFNLSLSEASSSLPEKIPDSSKPPVNGASYLECISSAGESRSGKPKASYSPFSTPNKSQAKSDSLYDPPNEVNENLNSSEHSIEELREASTSKQESYLSALDDTSGSGVKTSYVPFGTKPKAVRDNGLYSPGNFIKNN